MTTRVPLNMAGALAPSGGSDTAALQAALATGRDVLLAPGTWATGDEVLASITYSV